MRCAYVKSHNSFINVKWDFFVLPIVMEKATVLWDAGKLSGSHFGAIALSAGHSRTEQMSSDIPQNIPQLPAALEGVSVHSAAFSWSHFPELAHNPGSQSKYLTTTASSDKEAHGLTTFCVFFYFFWTLLLLVSWSVSWALWWRDIKQLFPICLSLSQF